MTDHACTRPRWRRARYRHTPWVCSCGRAWLARHEYVSFNTGGGLDVTRWVWTEWNPRPPRNRAPKIGTTIYRGKA